MMVFAQVPYVALAQYTGGSYGGDEESSLKGGVYTGGSQTGTAVSSSASGSLAHGAATQLVFTQIPSASKHGNKFERQPKVEIRDANNNLLTTDNSTKVTLAIFNNPGNGELRGTKTVTVSGGVAIYTDLEITKAAEMYTLIATASGITSALSDSFDIFPGTGVKIAAVWDETADAYTIFTWLEMDNQRQDLDGSDICADATIYNAAGTGFDSIDFGVAPPDGPDLPVAAYDYCQSQPWTPTAAEKDDSFFIDVSIYWDGSGWYKTYAPLALLKPALSDLANVNWDLLAAIKAKTDTINWEDIAEIKAKTDTINWADISVLRSDVTDMKGNLDLVNWSDLQVMTEAHIDWADFQSLTAAGINWADINLFSKAGVNWSDFASMTAKGINWSEIGVLSEAGINWTDLDILTKAGVNWADVASLTRANVNWLDIGRLSQLGVNWDNLDYLTKAGVNWDDLAYMTGSGTNWTSYINWDDLATLSNAGVNWTDLNVMTQAGVNWDGLKEMSEAHVNWTDLYTMTVAGVNWTDIS
ncbi:MAG: hypothetical protein KKD07_10715, partial [Candidatus Omnitrophica bacterium]|nr:hypothetical protein [Candidatus Omnitrophota bacterium]